MPIGKTDPGAGPAVRVVVAPGQLSVPTGGVQVAIAPDGHVGSSVMLAGHVICGGVLSTTVTTCVSSAKLPLLSVALYVIVVFPTGKTFPAGTPIRVTTTPGQLSLAVAVPSVASRLATVTPHDVAPAPVNSVTSAGAVIVGGTAGSSVTVTV